MVLKFEKWNWAVTILGLVISATTARGQAPATTPAASSDSDTTNAAIQTQTACETKLLRQLGAREVFSGKAYEVLTEVAQAYVRVTPHIYIFPGSWNSAYIAGSTALDGRGKIVVGQQAIERFDEYSLKGFLGHEMAHVVSDSAVQGCNDHILRDPQVEANADALAARTLGTGPVMAFLQRALALTQDQNWEAKQRLEVLQSLQSTISRRAF